MCQLSVADHVYSFLSVSHVVAPVVSKNLMCKFYVSAWVNYVLSRRHMTSSKKNQGNLSKHMKNTWN